jgi:hypothetical protein
VGFLTLLFGVLYTVEMSLQTAQLNSHNPDCRSGPRSTFLQSKQSQQQSGDSKKDNNEELEDLNDDQDEDSVREMFFCNIWQHLVDF